jgi:hypothetical protein
MTQMLNFNVLLDVIQMRERPATAGVPRDLRWGRTVG